MAEHRKYTNRALVAIKWMSENDRWVNAGALSKLLFGEYRIHHVRLTMEKLLQYGLVDTRVGERQRVEYRLKLKKAESPIPQQSAET